MPGAFDFSDFQEQDSNFGFNPGLPTQPPPQAAPVDPYTGQPIPRPRPSPVQVDPYTGQTTVQQAPPPGTPSGRRVVGYRDGIPIESNQPPGSRPMCPKDGTPMHRAGSRPSGTSRRLSAWTCPLCGYTTTKRLPGAQDEFEDQ